MLHDQSVLVVAQVESPEPRGFSVHVGAALPALETASGAVLLAWADRQLREEILESVFSNRDERAREQARLDVIVRRGFEHHRSRTIRGIIDLSFPVCSHAGVAIAALTVPCLSERGRRSEARDVEEQLATAVRELTAAIGGRLPSRDGA